MALALGGHTPSTIPQPKAVRLAPSLRSTSKGTPAGFFLLPTGALVAPHMGRGLLRRRRITARAGVKACDVAVPTKTRPPQRETPAVQPESPLQKASANHSDSTSNARSPVPSSRRKGKRFIDCVDIVNKHMNNKMPDEFCRGVTTGWASLDRLYRPVRGEVTVVTGTPGSGKSEFLFSLALNLAMTHGWRFHCVPFEHKHKDWTFQLLEKLHEVRIDELGCFDLKPDLDFLEEHFSRAGTFSEDLSLDDILASAEYTALELKSKGGLHGLMIDPYNCIEMPSGYQSETQVVSTMMSKLQQFAKRHSSHVWIVVHPTKGSQLAGNEPSMYDCSGSAHWFNKCDNGIIVRRPFAKSWAQQQEREKTGSSRQVDIKVDKVRNYYAGQLGTAKMIFNPDTRGYEEL